MYYSVGIGPHPYGNIWPILIFITLYYADIDKESFICALHTFLVQILVLKI